MTVAGNLAIPLITAVVDILSTDAEIIALLGARAPGTPYVVPFEDINDADDPTTAFELPIFVYDYRSEVDISPNPKEKEVVMTLDAIADAEHGGLTVITDMLTIAKRALTWNNFDARGLDCFVRHPIPQEASPSDPEATRGLRLHRLTLTMRATTP